MHTLLSVDSLIALVTLTAMEIVLGIDNIIFVAILVAKLPYSSREKARKLGIALALIMRIALLLSLSWMMRLTHPLLTFAGQEISGRDLILLSGGLFLIAKSTYEIHSKVTQVGHSAQDPVFPSKNKAQFRSILVQILVLDIVFSLDSVITAVGMAQDVAIMIIAMVLSVGVMLLAARGVSVFIEKHPTIKVLALSFLLMIGVMLVMEGLGSHVNKGYIYFAMAFSLGVEFLNMKLRRLLP